MYAKMYETLYFYFKLVVVSYDHKYKSHHKLGILIRTGRIVFPDPIKHKIYMSEELKDIITKLLERNPATRLGSKQDVDEVKSHPFFKGVDWDALYNRAL